MKSSVLAMPDDPAERAGWLDRRLTSTDLAPLMGELRAVWALGKSTTNRLPDEVAFDRRQPPSSAAEVRDWLGDDLERVLAGGVAALSPARMNELLRRPHLLPGLQELVLTEGGEHWENLIALGMPLPPRRADGHAAGSGLASNPAAAPGGTVEPADRPQPAVRPGAGHDSIRPAGPASGDGGAGPRMLRGLVAVAAAVMLAVAAWRLAPGPAATWGWNRPSSLAAAPAPEYLENLAAAAGEWSAEVPQSEAALARRLRDLLAGCDRLIAARHEPLTAADRAWLVERCGVWRAKIAGHLAALEADHDVAAVREAADATVEKLEAAIRTRAQEIRAREAAA